MPKWYIHRVTRVCCGSPVLNANLWPRRHSRFFAAAPGRLRDVLKGTARMADYNFFSIVDASHDDDAIYPVLSAPDVQYPVEITAEDGRVSYFQASKAVVQQPNAEGRLTQVIQLPTDIKWECLITDTRVIVYCTKYDKGGGWIGLGAGALFAVAANAVSMARAAHRRKGKVLVGQVRYPWLSTVGGKPKQGWNSAENLRFLVNAQPRHGGSRNLYLTLVLPKQVDAASVAYEIGTRAARWHLTSDPQLAAENKSKYEEIASGPRKVPVAANPGELPWAWYAMPSSYRVNSLTARPKPSVELLAVDIAPAEPESAEPPDPAATTVTTPADRSSLPVEPLPPAASTPIAARAAGDRVCVWMKCSLEGQPTSATRCPECGIPTEPRR